MNRGAALKWAEALNNVPSDVRYDNSQIGFIIVKDGREEKFLSPIGVLCSFMDPNGFERKQILDLGDNLIFNLDWHGETFVLPDAWRKKCKIKSPWMDVVINEGNMKGLSGSLYEVLDGLNPPHAESDHSSMFQKAGEIVEAYYEQM